MTARRSISRALGTVFSLVLPLLLGGAGGPLVGGSTAAAAAGTTERPVGPALAEPRRDLREALTCSGGLDSDARPVLLVHGTTFTGATNFDWNYERALEQIGRPWCTVDLPRSGMADIAVAAEYVTHAIRTMARRSGDRVDVVGYSQGGMVPRWSLKYWPDTRGLVDDVVGIDPSSYGTLDAQLLCRAACPPAFWQQRTGARFLAALNTGPDTWDGIDYTVVYTATDEVVTPNLPPRPASALRDGAGRRSLVAVQEVCPVHLADHLSMGTTDPVGWAVVRDALAEPGPGRASRIPTGVCLRDVMPGVDRARLPANLARATRQVASALATSPQTPAEPALPAYAR